MVSEPSIFSKPKSSPALSYYKLHSEAIPPTFSTTDSACFDISCSWLPGQKINGYNEFNEEIAWISNESFYLSPGDRILVPTGLVFYIPKYHSIQIYPRSGLSVKLGLNLANKVGIIDSDYYQECFITAYNQSRTPVRIQNKTRLCQGKMVQDLRYDIVESTEPPQQISNRVGGFGSTGV